MTPQRLIVVTAAVAIVALAAIFVVPRLGTGTASAAGGELSLAEQPSLGAEDAPVEVVLFEDFLCPHCGTFSETVLPRIERNFVDSGDARVFYKNFVVMGPEAERVALVGECVLQQGNDAFWALEPVLYRSQDGLDEQRAVELANQYVEGLDGEALQQCVDEDEALDAVRADNGDARDLGLTGTPSVLVAGEQVSNPTYDGVASAIEDALADAQ